eukprot:6901134-Pyramimonas_sp.AAC.1
MTAAPSEGTQARVGFLVVLAASLDVSAAGAVCPTASAAAFQQHVLSCLVPGVVVIIGCGFAPARSGGDASAGARGGTPSGAPRFWARGPHSSGPAPS